MILTVVEVKGTDQYGQLHVRVYIIDGHVNAARQLFIEEMTYEVGVKIANVKARKVGEQPA